ncbi:MAG: KEOPS complex subunit Pcc1 [Candidatus Bathyarchaeia archaeon]
MKAIIKIRHRNSVISKSVAKSVEPDNLLAPSGVKIMVKIKRETTITKICGRDLETFISTIDDLLLCMDAANKTLEILEDEGPV